MKAMRTSSDGISLYIGILFFASGFSSLMLQTSWNRILAQVIGIDFQSQIIVVSIFMLGLGLGSYVGGFITREFKQPLYFFACAEIVISIFAFFSDSILRSSQKYLSKIVMGDYGALSLSIDFIGYSLVLLLPILLMGTSLPIVIHSVRNRFSIGIATGTFYGINLFGAVIGTLASGVYLLGEYGIRGVLQLAGTVNLLLAIGFLLLVRNSKKHNLPNPKENYSQTPESYKVPIDVKFYAISCGLISIGFEILFFRILTFFFGAKSYVFPLALSVFLLHVMIGSLISAGLLQRKKTPVKSLVWALYATLLLSLIPFLLSQIIVFFFPKYGISSFVLPDNTSFIELIFVWIVVLFLMLCVVPISMAFPLIVSMNSVKDGEEGSAVSSTYFITTLGNFIATLLVGAFLIPRFGIVSSYMFLVFMIIAVLVTLCVKHYPLNNFKFGALNLSFLVVALTFSIGFYKTAHYKFEPPIRIHNELNGTILVHQTLDDSGELNGFRINSGSEPATSFDVFDRGWKQKDRKLDASLAALGYAPSRVLIIGIGTGDFLIDITNHFPEARIVIVELYESVIKEMLLYGSPELRNVLKNSEIHILDGARYINSLDTSSVESKFDLIQIGVNHVTAAGAGNLFTREFLAQAAKNLAENGIISTNAYAPVVSMLKAENKHFFIYSSGNGYPADLFITNQQHNSKVLFNRLKASYKLMCGNLLKNQTIEPLDLAPPYGNFIINGNKSFDSLIRGIKPLTYNTLNTDHFVFQRIAIPDQVDSRVWDSAFASINGEELRSIWLESCSKD
jgi:spermidine synthase